MRIATYNVNGINGRLANLLGWLEEAAPDIACLQELKAPDDKFPAAAIRAAGYGAVWHGQKSWNGVAILARGAEPVETRRGLPGDPDDAHSRYIEAAAGGLIIGCLYLPNGNPAPGPKFDYKLRWFERLTSYGQTLLDSGAPAVLAGDFNVMPTDLDVYAPERWVDDALFRPEVRDAYRRLVEQGWTDALRALYPSISTSTTSPGFIHKGGLRAKPTPSGVPVEITSPATSGVQSEQYEIRVGMSKIRSSIPVCEELGNVSGSTRVHGRRAGGIRIRHCAKLRTHPRRTRDRPWQLHVLREKSTNQLALFGLPAGAASHSFSFDHRRRPETLRTAIATAFFWPTSTTSRFPRVTPV